jgi:RNA polymerase sigma-70 factor (ECF subfamily)
MLRYVEGMSLDEIASACDCSLATTKRRIFAAQTQVAKHVQLSEPGLE